MSLNIEDQAYSVIAAGYTIMPNQIGASDLNDLRAGVDRAFAAAQREIEKGRNDPIFHYPAVQAMYVWGEACLRLLEHDAIHALTERLMREYRLWGYNVLDRAPHPTGAPLPVQDAFEGIGYHQDFSIPFHGAPHPFYLWHFVCLDDVTPENGATWVIPGSHRATELMLPQHGEHRTIAGGAALQVCARAGDILSINPCCYHTPGVNYSRDKRRRYLAVQLCYATLPPLQDHWAIAGPKIQAAASPRLRMLLGADIKPAYPHALSGYVLPEGWETAGEPFSEGKNIMGQVPAAQQLRDIQHRAGNGSTLRPLHP